MGFVSDILNGKYGLDWYNIVGTLIFISLFIVILIRTIRLSRSEIKEYKESIFDLDERPDTQ